MRIKEFHNISFHSAFFLEKDNRSAIRKERSEQSIMVHGIKKSWVHFRLKLSLLNILIESYPNPADWFKGLRFLVKLRRKFLGENRIKKMALISGKYYMGLFTPGWNDALYKRFIKSELVTFKKFETQILRFNHVFLAITKKCALSCEHCYEWENLNQRDSLNEDKIKRIIIRLQKEGVGQIHLTGGEPLLKFDMIIRLLKTANKDTHFWLNTSGYQLTYEKAKQLKEAGLTGILISLDHYLEEEHDKFRKLKGSFMWATKAAQNGTQNGLVVGLSLCTRKEFVSEENLFKYMRFAKELKVPFVQFLEPRAVGHYSNKNVSLCLDTIQLLESFFLKMNFTKENREYPIICYHGYYQRRNGCFSAGKKGIYIDTDGDINACPFCQAKTGNILEDDFQQSLNDLKKIGCHNYS